MLRDLIEHFWTQLVWINFHQVDLIQSPLVPDSARKVLDLYQKRSGGTHLVEVDNAGAPERF
jgi:hypothetical protein